VEIIVVNLGNAIPLLIVIVPNAPTSYFSSVTTYNYKFTKNEFMVAHYYPSCPEQQRRKVLWPIKEVLSV